MGQIRLLKKILFGTTQCGLGFKTFAVAVKLDSSAFPVMGLIS